MGTYTPQTDPRIDDAIQADMDIIRQELVEHLAPVSILLTGSFGRGEGTVTFAEGRFQPLNDYDILVITDRPVPELQILAIESDLHGRLHYPRPGERASKFSEFAITLFQTTLNDINSYANVGSYELKTGSRIIYGTDIRSAIPLTTDDIPVVTGFHFLFQKSIHLLGQFSLKYIREPPEGKEKTNLIYKCGKAYIDMGTALSLLGGFYYPSYAERNRRFAEQYAGTFPDLEQRIPDLAVKIDRFTRLKFCPDPAVYDSMDPVAVWFGTVQDLLAVTGYYLERCSKQKPPEGIPALSAALYAYTRKEYFREQLGYYLRIRYGVESNAAAVLVSALYQRYTALEFYFRLKAKNRQTLHGLTESPILRLFSLAPVLLAAISPAGEVDPHLMEYFHDGFRSLVNDPALSGHEQDWESARISLISASELYNRLR